MLTHNGYFFKIQPNDKISTLDKISIIWGGKTGTLENKKIGLNKITAITHNSYLKLYKNTRDA